MLIKHANLYKFSKSLIWLFNWSWLEQIRFTVLFTHAESLVKGFSKLSMSGAYISFITLFYVAHKHSRQRHNIELDRQFLMQVGEHLSGL